MMMRKSVIRPCWNIYLNKQKPLRNVFSHGFFLFFLICLGNIQDTVADKFRQNGIARYRIGSAVRKIGKQLL